jgi:16S rRNA (cytosine967-C5)-methyltransferase
MEDKARYIAVKTLCDIDESGAFSNIKLNQYFKMYDLEAKDRGFATEILYGTIRWKLRIDFLIQKFSKLKLDKMNCWVLNSIRIAVYQVFFMDKVPEFAAVNQSVEIVKAKEKRATSFANGVLRNILRNKDEFTKIDIKDGIKRLSVEYSHPEWFVRKFKDELGESRLIELMRKNNTPPGLTIRVNSLKSNIQEVENKLVEKGVQVEHGQLEESLVLKGYNIIEKSEEFQEGLFTIQDESSMLVARVLDPLPGDKIIDVCSAPGGKTTHIAQLMKNKGEIKAFDVHEHKLKLVKGNAKRLGIGIINTYIKDSSIYSSELGEVADKVLVDAPCSGLGLIMKKPEIRWNISLKDIEELTNIQYEILRTSSRYVKKNGVLVYSTCTITKEENENIIEKFLAEHEGFEMMDISEYVPERYRDNTCKEGYVKLYPDLHDTDGFFIAKLRRKW